MKSTCKLCGETKGLHMSHILPKSFTRRMRAGAPQVIAVTVDEKPKAAKANGEHVERMLCGDCEHLIKVQYEDYGTRLFVQKQNITENRSHVFITNFDYQTYFLFIVSILWRASVSKLNIYKSTHGLAELSELIKPCIRDNTLHAKPPYEVALDEFVKITILKIVDHKSEIPQRTIDSLILGLNVRRGASVEEGLHYYFMVDGFLVTASLFPLHSLHLKGWRASGRMLNRSHVKVPKVSFYDIQEIYEGIAAIASTPDPFSK